VFALSDKTYQFTNKIIGRELPEKVKID